MEISISAAFRTPTFTVRGTVPGAYKVALSSSGVSPPAG